MPSESRRPARIETLDVYDTQCHKLAGPAVHRGGEVVSMDNTSAPQDQATGTQDAAGVEELLVEEVSIDGMCGVY